MKKTISIFSTLIFLFGCQNWLDISQNSQIDTKSSLSLSEEIIIQAIDDLWYTVHQDTKVSSHHPDLLSISPINTHSVKSTDSGYSQSYIVNFTDDKGFAIVNIDGMGACVLALTESGNLNSSLLFNKTVSFDSEEEQFYYKYIENLILKKEAENNALRSQRQLTKAQTESTTWYTDTIVYPIVHVKWGQEYPFNMSMPAVPSSLSGFGPTSPFRGRHAVGCVTIAAMQIAVATEHPYSFSVNNQSIDSYLFSDISFYGNYSQYNYNTYDASVSDYMKTKTEVLANLMYNFNLMINATFKDDGSTSAHSLNAMNYLDYLDHSRYGSLDLEECPYGNFSYHPVIFSMLNAGKPLIVDGWEEVFTGIFIGHSWVIDGYMKQHQIGLDNEIHSRKLVHFNWGWHGKYDGYYHNAALGDRDYTDTSYDPDPSPVFSLYDFNDYICCYIY